MTSATTTSGVLLAAALLLAGCDEERVGDGDRGSETTSTATGEDGRCEHGVPGALCPKCNPALAAVYRARGDWCEEHGFPESFCPICDPNTDFPEVGTPAADAPDWCAEHGLPESMCTRCNPALIERFVADGDFCEEHGFPESVCPVCNPHDSTAELSRRALEARTVVFRSAAIEGAAGIETVAARRGTAAASVECTARIAFDADRIADIRAIVPGVVRTVHAELGANVDAGAPLFTLESTRVGEIQGALGAARQRVRTSEANLARQQELQQAEIASARQLEVAQQELSVAQAEQRAAAAALRMAGAAGARPSGRYTLTAPIAGTVVRRPAVVGLYATESTSLATIGDLSVMWALCDVPEADASRVALGQSARVVVDGVEGEGFEGEITWIAAEVDPRTRTVAARAEVENAERRLRANQFARARIETGAPREAVAVPRDAVQRVEAHELVFVRTAAGIYEPRVITRHAVVTIDGASLVHVEGRVEVGDEVVTTGAVLLRTEVMPGSIGAGCCEVEPPGGG